MGGITTKMKRIIDIDKLQEERQEKQKTYWQRIKNDPVKFGHYKEWRKQYVNKKKPGIKFFTLPFATNIALLILLRIAFLITGSSRLASILIMIFSINL
jgi:uncharacterized membrane protein